MSSLFFKWIINHKTVSSLSLISIPLIYYTYQKKKRRQYERMQLSIKPLLSFQANSINNNQSLSFFQSIITHNEVIDNIEQCLYQVITSNEMNEKIKDIGNKIVEHALTDRNLHKELKDKFIEIANSKEINRESGRFLQFIKQDDTLSNNISNFIDSVLSDEDVLELLNEMAKDRCYKALNHQNVVDNMDLLTNEIMSNEELIKYMYNKAINIFSNKNSFDINGNGNKNYKF